MIAWVDEHGFEPNELPYKFEAGTPPIAEAIALGAAIDYLRQFDRAQLAAWEAHLYRRLRDGLVAIDGLRLLADLPPEIWDYIKRRGFFAMIIPKRYGGLEFSAFAHSAANHSLTLFSSGAQALATGASGHCAPGSASSSVCREKCINISCCHCGLEPGSRQWASVTSSRPSKSAAR